MPGDVRRPRAPHKNRHPGDLISGKIPRSFFKAHGKQIRRNENSLPASGEKS